MRALIYSKAGEEPKVGDFKDPVAEDKQQVARVVIAGINPFDRSMLGFTNLPLPRVVGVEAIVSLANGKMAYAESASPYGSIAEKTIVKNNSLIELPDGVNVEHAIIAGISGLAAGLPLTFKAKLQPSESVLILGATGVQGQTAVQVAKLLGASHVTAAGRNKEVLENLKGRGADSVAVLEGDLSEALKSAAPKGGYDVVIDSLYGKAAEALIKSGTLNGNSRVVILGGNAGTEINLALSDLYATKGATFSAYSTFFVPEDIKKRAYLKLLEHLEKGEIEIPTKIFPLEEAEEAWKLQSTGPHQKIMVKPQKFI